MLALRNRAELAPVVAEYLPKANEWASVQNRELVDWLYQNNPFARLERDILDERLSKSKRRRDRFDLHITEVPTLGAHGWVLGPSHLLVTRELAMDHRQYAHWLTFAIDELL